MADIMYNVDQQMFGYCTAKFSDNTQCCVPVFDVKHELPLCPEHAAKAVSDVSVHSPSSCTINYFINLFPNYHNTPHNSK